MPTDNRRPPSWSSVWLEAVRQHRDPVAALVAAGLVTAEEVAPGPPAEPAICAGMVPELGIETNAIGAPLYRTIHDALTRPPRSEVVTGPARPPARPGLAPSPGSGSGRAARRR
jgi:hypothetical protein